MSISLEENKSKLSIKRNILSSYKNRIAPLEYNFVNFTSQDPSHPINYLLNNKNTKGGWISNRYCTYPQEIFIQFPTMVNIRQINILINECKIPKSIELINCIPVGEKNKFIINNNNVSKLIPSEFMYQNIGYIKLSTNVESNYKARELRKIYININTEYIKLIINSNYPNNLNMFCQVGIVSLDFLGTKKDNPKKKEEKINIPENIENNKINDTIETLFEVGINTDEVKEDFIDEKMDKETKDKLKELIEEMNTKKENEEYDECKLIKDKIDKIRKIALKIYTLEEEKKEYVNKNDFDKAKEMKFNIDKIKKLLDFYLKDKSYNKKIEEEKNNDNNNLNNKPLNNINNRKSFVSENPNELNNENFIQYDDIIIPVVMKKLKKNNNSFIKSGNNSGENSLDSFDNIKENEPQEKEPLEELDDNLKSKYELLICFVGEDTLRKIFSKFIYYKEEGFDILKIKVKEIINEQKNTSEANKYIVLLIDIIYNFLDDKHPSIVFKCLDIFNNILEAIDEKSKKSKISYDFTITKKILNKIKEKLNDISKKVRVKASDLYCFMLDTDFCEYNTLLIELIENEVFNHFNKYLLKVKRYKLSSNNNLNLNYINKNESKSSKQLIIAKMDIFLRVLKNFNEAVKKKKTDKQKFPQNILGDFIIMNINHPKDDVREITKDVMVKFIEIFGNKIFNKMQMIIDDKELSRIIHDKLELKIAYENIRKKIIENEKNKINVSNSVDNIFLTNVNKKFKSKNKNSQKKELKPIKNVLNGRIKLNNNINNIKNKNFANKQMIRSTSQPKFPLFKNKLKPINMKRNNNKGLVNSKSQKILDNVKK